MSQETQYTTTIVDVRCGVKSSNAGVCCVDEFRVCGNSRLSRVCVGVCCIVYKTMTAMLVLPAALTAGPSLCLILCCLWYRFYGDPPGRSTIMDGLVP